MVLLQGGGCVVLFRVSVLLMDDTVFSADLRGIWELVSVGLNEDSSVEIYRTKSKSIVSINVTLNSLAVLNTPKMIKKMKGAEL